MSELTVEEARARMLSTAGAPRPELVPLGEAAGRVLAEPVIAERDQPPFDVSAMDGWAVAGDGPTYHIAGESAAGRGFDGVLGPGQAVRIFTGAPTPLGAERVVLQENAARDGHRIRVDPCEGASCHIRLRGGDFRGGDVLLEVGVRLDAWRIGLAAAAGRAGIVVARRPIVALLSTGDELVAPGRTAGARQIFNSNGPTLATLVALWGGEPVLLAPVSDDLEAIAEAAAAAPGDLLVAIGGASVGDRDLVKPALRRLGLALQVEKVGMRPGKPIWFGLLDDGRRVLGLPGNPAAALVCAELFLKPLLLAIQGAEPGPRLVGAKLTKPMPMNGSREHWARAMVILRGGEALAEPMLDQDSSLVRVFAAANALIRRPAGAPPANVGAVIDALLLERL